MGGMEGCNLHMSDVPLFWVAFWGAPGFLASFFGVLPEFWVSFFFWVKFDFFRNNPDFGY